jgi:hypothetical protein
MLEHFNAMAWMTRRIRRDEHSFNAIIFNHFLQRRVGFRTAACFRQCRAAIGDKIAYRYDFDVRMVLEPKCRTKLAKTVPSDPDADFALGYSVPAFRSVWILLCLLETLNGLLLRNSQVGQAERSGSDTDRLKEAAPVENGSRGFHSTLGIINLHAHWPYLNELISA